MAILYTIGSINLKTVKLVAKAIRESEPQTKIHKVVIFDSVESEKLQNEQIAIYRKYFGDFIREGILLNNDGTRLQQLILEEKLEELRYFSESIKDTLLQFVQCIEKHGGVVYMNGGDNIFATCSRDCAQIVTEYVHMENIRGSVCYSLAIA